MKTKSFEEVRKALLVAKESIEKNIEDLNRLEKEEEPATLRIESKRERVIAIPQAELGTIKGGIMYIEDHIAMNRRSWGPLAGKAFYLNDCFDWQIGKDEEGLLCLVPLKKVEI